MERTHLEPGNRGAGTGEIAPRRATKIEPRELTSAGLATRGQVLEVGFPVQSAGTQGADGRGEEL